MIPIDRLTKGMKIWYPVLNLDSGRLLEIRQGIIREIGWPKSDAGSTTKTVQYKVLTVEKVDGTIFAEPAKEFFLVNSTSKVYETLKEASIELTHDTAVSISSFTAILKSIK